MSSNAVLQVGQQLQRSVAEWVPTSKLGIAYALLVIYNLHGFPLNWHIRAIGPYFWYLFSVRLAILLGLRKPAPNTNIGSDPLDYSRSKELRAWPSETDMFGFHLSNSSYAARCDELRGGCLFELLGGAYGELPGGGLALGATNYHFIRQVDFLQKYTLTTSFVGHDRKWMYLLHSFTSKNKDGTTKTHCLALSHLVLKIGRRTVPPNRALALAGYGPDGEANWAIVNKLSAKERIRFLMGEKERDEWGVVVGEEEMNMHKKGDWPAQL